MTNDESTGELLTSLTDELERGNGAIVLVPQGGGLNPHHLRLKSTPVSTVATIEAAEYLLEHLVERCEAITDGSAAGILPHLKDALRSFQAITAVRSGDPFVPAVGHG